ncbi:DoxX family protein [soil metagenome]
MQDFAFNFCASFIKSYIGCYNTVYAMNHILPLLARLLLVPIFTYSAINKLGNPMGTIETMREVGMTVATEVLMYGSIAVLLIGSLLVLLGFKTRLGAILLLLFLVPTTFLFHWDFESNTQIIALYKNAGLASALLLLTAFGPGGVSLDAKRLF